MAKRIEREIHRTKIIVRHLPCKFTEEKLREVLEPCPKYDYFRFVPGDPSFGTMGFARAYINFTNEEDIVPFRERYDGYVFEDDYGNKSYTVVEFAPFQRIPRKTKRKVDSKCGTIDSDADYITFCETLKEEVTPLPSVDKTLYLLEEQKTNDLQSTHLIEFLKDKKERKEKLRVQKELRKKERRAKEKARKEKSKQDTSVSVKIIKSGKVSESRGESKSLSTSSSQLQERPVSKEKSGAKYVPTEPIKGNMSSSVPPSAKLKQPQSQSHEKASVRIIARPGQGQRRGQQQTGGESFKPSSPSDTQKSSNQESTVQSERKTSGGHRNRDRPDRAMYVPRGRTDQPKRDKDEGDTTSRRDRGSSSRYRGGGRGRGAHQDRGKSFNERAN